MNEHSVQVVISEPGGRQVQVNWQGTAPHGPLVLQVASIATPATPVPPVAPPVAPRHEFFPAAAAALNTPSASPAISVELLFPAPADAPSTPSVPRSTSPLSLQLRWCEPPPPPPVSKPASEPAPLATAWAVECLRQRHLAATSAPARRRAARAGR
jgi:hypothetical protein